MVGAVVLAGGLGGIALGAAHSEAAPRSVDASAVQASTSTFVGSADAAVRWGRAQQDAEWVRVCASSPTSADALEACLATDR